MTKQSPKVIKGKLVGLVVILAAVVYASFYFSYQGKIMPGVAVDGLAVGGLTREQATAQVAAHVTDFQNKVILVNYSSGGFASTARLIVRDMSVKYDVSAAVDRAYGYGRSGDWARRLAEQARALGWRGTAFFSFTYDDATLATVMSKLADEVNTPAVDATLSYAGGDVLVRAGAAGRRLDLGQLAAAVNDRLATASEADIAAPLYNLPPLTPTADLKAVLPKAKVYLSAPLTLGIGAASQQEVQPETILGWIKTTRAAPKQFTDSHDLSDLYLALSQTTLGLNRVAVAAFVANLAKTVNKPPVNAGVTWDGSRVVVTAPSANGARLDQAQATDNIIAVLAQTDPGARVGQLAVAVIKPDVREDNLDALGIKDRLSEGETYFPGSSENRLTNVRVGAARFNGVVIKPGETFSFGEALGPVGPEQGYAKGLIILDNKEVPAYGGGLCQVATTAYRAALLAGLDIVERTNHAFAIDFYTWPYGVPGVDATLYYPPVDLKFKNDTPAYILIQTHMEGSRLKFDFYGTKTKYGVVEPPVFLEGNNDATKPSKTIFYRDIYDLTGKKIAHDPVVTSYKSSLDFTVQD